MKKQDEKTVETVSEELNNALVSGNMEGVNLEEAFDILEKADDSKMENLTQEFFKFDTVGLYNVIITGLGNRTIDGKTAEVVEMLTKDGKQWISNATVLVNAAKQLTTLPAYARINYKGEKGQSGKRYKDLSVKVLPNAVK